MEQTKPANNLKRKLLVCGLGGGLDSVNAALLYFAAKKENVDVTLGSTRYKSTGHY